MISQFLKEKSLYRYPHDCSNFTLHSSCKTNLMLSQVAIFQRLIRVREVASSNLSTPTVEDADFNKACVLFLSPEI
jgi:hypothetical protein